MTKNQKAEMYKQIEKHGWDLLVLFPNATIKEPIALCKTLRRLEVKANYEAAAGCNGYYFEGGPQVDSEETNRKGELLALKARAILGVTGTACPFTFFFNGDARGYALKLSGELPNGIYKDWGGYGIIAPDFSPIEKQ